MSAADRLDQIEARANAATEGPWTPDEYTEVDPDGFHELSRVIAPDPDGDDWCAIGVVHTGILRPDADFIAAARTDVPALVAALRAVHQIAFDPDTESALEVGQIRNGPYIEGVSKDEALSYARDALRDVRDAIEEALS